MSEWFDALPLRTCRVVAMKTPFAVLYDPNAATHNLYAGFAIVASGTREHILSLYHLTTGLRPYISAA